MAEVAFHKLNARDGHGFELLVGAVFPKKSDRGVGERDDPTVGNDAASDVVAEIADGLSA